MIRLSDGRDLAGGSFTFEPFAIASGDIELWAEPTVGEFIEAVFGWSTLFTAVVTSKRYDHKRGVWIASLKDPVSAYYKKGVEYDAGAATSAMGSVVYQAGGYFSGSSTLQIAGTHEDPVDWIDLVKTVAFATKKGVTYTTFGEYVFGMGRYDIFPIDPFDGTSEIDLERYGNKCVVTVDEDWTEEATVTHQEIETGVGVSRTVVKMGERPVSAITTYEDGSQIIESWEYDEDGTLTEYETVETATENSVTVEETTTNQQWSVTENGIEHTQTVTVRQNYDPYSQWVNVPDTLQNVSKVVTVTRCGVEETSMIRVYEEIYTYNPAPSPGEPVWELWEKVYKTGVPDAAGLVGSSIAKHYRYVIDPVEGEWWALNKTEKSGALSRPTTTKVLPVNKLGSHFSATAEDSDAIALYGEVEREFSALGLTTIEDAQACAQGFYEHCAHCYKATVTVPMETYMVGDFVSWQGMEWVIDSIAHDLKAERTSLTIVRRALSSQIEDAMGADTPSIAGAIVSLVERKGKRLDNAARAQIVAQIDYETYQVRVQGDPEGKTRTARVDYQRGETFSPGKEVLLVRPTGKRGTWEIVTRRHDEPTIHAAAEVETVTPHLTVTTDKQYYEPTTDVYLTATVGDSLQVDWGDGSDIETYKWRLGKWELESDGSELTHYYTAPLNPAENPSQSFTGQARLTTNGATTAWVPFTVRLEAPHVEGFAWSLGTLYYEDEDSYHGSEWAPCVDATFTFKIVDLAEMTDGDFYFQSGRGYERQLNTADFTPDENGYITLTITYKLSDYEISQYPMSQSTVNAPFPGESASFYPKILFDSFYWDEGGED